MKLSHAWAELCLKEAQFKILSLFTASVALISTLGVVILSQREPLVVERSCESRSISLSSTIPTEEEIRAFLKNAMGMRFDSNESSSALLTESQQLLKKKELEEMKQRGIFQYVIPQVIEIKSDVAQIQMDRIISIGRVKTALNFQVNAKFARVPRSKENPYGLILVEVTRAQDERAATPGSGK